MSAAVRPVYVPGSAALEWLRGRAQEALDCWAREWVVGYESGKSATAYVHCADGMQPSLVHEYEVVSTENGCMWFRSSRVERLDLSCAVVGAELMPRSSHADDWIAGVVECAWDARNRGLCAALLGTPMPRRFPPSLTSLPATLFAAGAGSVQISCEGIGLYAVADSAVWDCVPPTRRDDVSHRLPDLTPLDRAVRRASARLDVMLGSAEVELPKLLDLRCGDVLRLPQRLDQGIAVLCEGQPLAQAALGQAQGRICVQLASNQPCHNENAL